MMDSVFRGNIQVVEVDIEPVLAPATKDKLSDDDDFWNSMGTMMASHTTDTQPLQEDGVNKQYGTTASNISNTTTRLDNNRVDSEAASSDGACKSAKMTNSSNNYTGALKSDDDRVHVRNGNEQSQIATREDGLCSVGDDEDTGASVTNNATSTDVDIVHLDVERGLRCGWLGYSPPFAQIFNNAKGYLFFLCMLSLIQSMTAFGLVYISLTTLEHRFGLDSFQSSFISSTYEISALAVSLIVTYLGERGHKPRWVGIGSVIFSLGSIIFALPHFLTGLYEAGELKDPLCQLYSSNVTGLSSCDENGSGGSESDLAVYYWIFIIAQILHGIGGSPLYSLGVTYMDENLPASDFGLYLGIFNASNTAGPALGNALGGLYLSGSSLTPSNPLWVGAWWLGFLINGSVLFLTSLLMLGYPKALPGSKEIASKRKSEVQRGKEFESGRGWKKRLQALPKAFLNLITNIPYMCLSLFICCEFFGAAIAVFGPKYFESQFNFSSSDAAFYTGVLSLAGVMTGALIGGGVIKKFDLKFKGLTRFAMLCTVITLGSACSFWLTCPNVPMAGVTVEYYNSSLELQSGPNITAMCNKNCSCGTSFDPVCGSDDVLYYSPCHAGCPEQTEDALYTDCSCIRNSSGPGFGTAEEGKCSTFCSSTRPYFLALFLLLVFNGMVIVPAWTATLRCLPFSQRNFGSGLQSLLYSALGTIPGPVVLGLMIDKSCLVWEEFCDGSQVCWMYENSDLALAFFLVIFVAKTVGLMFLIGALLSYRTPDVKEDDDGKYVKFENENITDHL